MGANASTARSERYTHALPSAHPASSYYEPSEQDSWYTRRRKPKRDRLIGRSSSQGTSAIGYSGSYFSPTSTSGLYTSQFGQFGQMSRSASGESPQNAQYVWMPVMPGTVPSAHGHSAQPHAQPPTPGQPQMMQAQTPVPMPPPTIPTPMMHSREEILVAPTINPIPNITHPLAADASTSSDATGSPSTDASGSSSGTGTTVTSAGAPRSGMAHDPLANNPLPSPPKESSIPEHLISATAMTQHTPNIAHSSPQQLQNEIQSPLERPLPPLPKDVYDSPEYRVLTIGRGYHHLIHPNRIYPEGWFEDEQERRKEMLERERHEQGWRNRWMRKPEKVNRRAASVVESTSSGPLLGASISRRLTKTMKRLGRLGGTSRRKNSAPMPFPAPFPGSPGTAQFYGIGVPNGQPFIPGVTPVGIAQTQPTTPGVQMPTAHPTGTDAQSPTTSTISPTISTPTIISPTVQIHRPPALSFDHTSPFSLSSPHSVYYKKKLYPTAQHLLEAHKFLGVRNDLAERVRQTRTVDELYVLAPEVEPYKRRDWEGVVISKAEEVLYLKFIQHPELRHWLFNTGISDLIFAEQSDPVWGTGPTGQGSNELGKALARVRDRLRREGSGR